MSNLSSNAEKKMLCNAGDVCTICDDIERYYKQYVKNGLTNEDKSLDIAKRTIIAEVELIREQKERDIKADSEFSTIDMLINALNNETVYFLHYVENIAMDIFDYERFNFTEECQQEELVGA